MFVRNRIFIIMPNKQAAKKALRKNVRQAAANIKTRANVKAFYVKTLNSAKQGKKTEVREFMKKFQQTVDKAVKLHVVSRNSAAKSKSVLMKAVNAIK